MYGYCFDQSHDGWNNPPVTGFFFLDRVKSSVFSV